MKKRCSSAILFVFLAIAGMTSGYGQERPVQKGLNAISERRAHAILNFFASDWMDGREPGTKGHDLAADYLASMFQVYGLKSIDQLKDPYAVVDNRFFHNNPYFQNFSMLMLNQSDGHQLSVVSRNGKTKLEELFQYQIDFTVSDFIGVPTRHLIGALPIVFVGYGLVDEKTGYNDFKGIDVRGKVVLRLRGYPGHNDTSSIAYKRFNVVRENLWQYMNYEYNKNKFAIERGAVACLEVNMENEALCYQGSNIFRYNRGRYESDVDPVNDKPFLRMAFLLEDSLKSNLLGYTISQRFANALMSQTATSLDAFVDEVKNTVKPASMELKNRRIKLESKADWELISCRNIIGVIEGENPQQVVVVGAHYDHLGRYKGIIYNGSDDNASGVVAILEIAKACLATGVKPKKTIVFAAWDVEEKGLYGSEYFLKHPTHDDIVANVNFDMISRNPVSDASKTYCKVSYTKQYASVRMNTEKFLKAYGLNLNMQYVADTQPSDGTDSDSFAEKDIPVINFETGRHKDYHKPSDHASRANITKMTDIIRMGFLHVWELANGDALK